MPETSPGPRSPLSLTPGFVAFVLAIIGLALVVAGARDAKPFGAGYLGLALLLVISGPASKAIARLDIGTPRLLLVLRRTLQARAGLIMRIGAAISGLALAVLAAAIGPAWPLGMRQFHGAFGVLVLLGALAWPWLAGEADTPSGRHWRLRALALVAALFAAATVAAYVTLFLKYTENSPYQDEYQTILPVITDAPDLKRGELLDRLIDSHWGHRVGVTRMFAYFQTRLIGHLDFFALSVVSNLFQLGFIAVMFWTIRREAHAKLLFVPFILIVLSPQYYTLILWGFSIQHFGIGFFVALTYLFLQRPGLGWLALAAAATIGAAYSFGNGVFVAPLGIAYLLVRTRYRDAVYWSTFTGFLLFRGFENMRVLDKERLLMWIEATPAVKLHYFAAWLGAYSTVGSFSDDWQGYMGGVDPFTTAFPLTEQVYWFCGLASGLLALGVGVLTAKRYWTRNLPAYGLAVILLVSAVLAANFRSGFGNLQLATAFSTRYSLNSILLLGLLYLAFVQLYPKIALHALPITLCASALFCAASYRSILPNVLPYFADVQFPPLMASNRLYGRTDQSVTAWNFSFRELSRAVDAGVYRIPEERTVNLFTARSVSGPLSAEPSAVLPLEICYMGENTVSYSFALRPAQSAAIPPPALVGVGLRDAGGKVSLFRLPALDELPVHLSLAVENLPEKTSHFGFVRKDQLPPGRLEVVILGLNAQGGADWAPTPWSVPTVHRFESALAKLPQPALQHELGFWRTGLQDGEGAYVPARTAGALTMTAPMTIEVLVRPIQMRPNTTVELWRLSSVGRNRNDVLRLAAEHDTFVISAWTGKTWEERVRSSATLSSWNWVAVVLDGQTATFLVCPQEQDSKHAASRVSGIAVRAALPLRYRIQLGTGRLPLGLQGVEIREARISDYLLDARALAANGPLFALPSDGP